MLEQVHDTKPELALTETQITGDQAGAIHDMAGFRSIMWIIYPRLIDTATAGSHYFTPKIEESDDSGMSPATEITGSRLLGTAVIEDTTKLGVLMHMGAVVHKRYVRFTYIETGTADATLTIIAVMGRPRHAPTT